MTSKLRGQHKGTRRERHGKRRILTIHQRLLDNLQTFGSMELCGYAMNEHRSFLTFRTYQLKRVRTPGKAHGPARQISYRKDKGPPKGTRRILESERNRSRGQTRSTGG